MTDLPIDCVASYGRDFLHRYKGMAFHTDPPAYGPTDEFASLSLGAERAFAFRSVSNAHDEHRLTLHNGSLLYMGENCQERYQHSLLRCENGQAPRINLTFRKYG
jgi:alkylated DNA repair dioxygenase AlkB